MFKIFCKININGSQFSTNDRCRAKMHVHSLFKRSFSFCLVVLQYLRDISYLWSLITNSSCHRIWKTLFIFCFFFLITVTDSILVLLKTNCYYYFASMFFIVFLCHWDENNITVHLRERLLLLCSNLTTALCLDRYMFVCIIVTSVFRLNIFVRLHCFLVRFFF